MNNKIICLNDENFNEIVLKSNGCILVDFWAEWCGPCTMVSPILEEIADEFDKIITIAKLNVDENKIITSKYNIKSIPTLLFFKEGKLLETNINRFSKGEITDFIKSNI
ncbi:MAG: thioredoxin [Enterobacterales bacterium]